MTLNLNLHARLTIESNALAVHSAIVSYWRGRSTAGQVVASTKRLRAQSRATRQIDARAADAILGTSALVEILINGAESAVDEGDIDHSDDRVREALNAVAMLRDALGTKETQISSGD